MSCVASNKVESPTAKVEGHRPWTTANLNPCVQIEKIRKFRLLLNSKLPPTVELIYVVDYVLSTNNIPTTFAIWEILTTCL